MDALHKWWFIFWSCVVGAAFAAHYNMFQALWNSDGTKLGYVTLVLFLATTSFIGVLTHRLVRKKDLSIEEYLGPCWFSTEAMNALAMIGTVGGFLLMFTTFHAFSPTDAAAAREAIAGATHGLSTAACTTFVGLLCSLLTKAQLVNLELAIKRMKNQPAEEKKDVLLG